MMPVSVFQKELSSLINEEVIVELKSNVRLKGILKAIDPASLSIVLGDVVLNNETYKSIIINGDMISTIYLKEKRVNLDELREQLERVFPKMVYYRKDQGVIYVMNRIKVTEKGVEGERGPVYDRVKRIYDEFMAKYRSV